jgi:hypothetical protein
MDGRLGQRYSIEMQVQLLSDGSQVFEPDVNVFHLKGDHVPKSLQIVGSDFIRIMCASVTRKEEAVSDMIQ